MAWGLSELASRRRRTATHRPDGWPVHRTEPRDRTAGWRASLAGVGVVVVVSAVVCALALLLSATIRLVTA